MARFIGDQIDNYSSGSGSFFRLKDDREKATVRFLYSDPDEIVGYSVHTVTIGDKTKYVNCLREYTDPIEACPFCAAGKKLTPKLFVPLYNETDGKLQLWERGKKFYSQLSALISRTPNLVSQVFEITRLGKANAQTTTYDIYPIGSPDETTLDDFEEIPEALGDKVLDKTAEEMEEFLDFGSFPEEDEQEPELPARRTPSRAEAPRRAPASPRQSNAGRRTPPARGGRRTRATEDEEAF